MTLTTSDASKVVSAHLAVPTLSRVQQKSGTVASASAPVEAPNSRTDCKASHFDSSKLVGDRKICSSKKGESRDLQHRHSKDEVDASGHGNAVSSDAETVYSEASGTGKLNALKRHQNATEDLNATHKNCSAALGNNSSPWMVSKAGSKKHLVVGNGADIPGGLVKTMKVSVRGGNLKEMSHNEIDAVTCLKHPAQNSSGSENPDKDDGKSVSKKNRKTLETGEGKCDIKVFVRSVDEGGIFDTRDSALEEAKLSYSRPVSAGANASSGEKNSKENGNFAKSVPDVAIEAPVDVKDCSDIAAEPSAIAVEAVDAVEELDSSDKHASISYDTHSAAATSIAQNSKQSGSSGTPSVRQKPRLSRPENSAAAIFHASSIFTPKRKVYSTLMLFSKSSLLSQMHLQDL